MTTAEFSFKVDLSDKSTSLKWRNILEYLSEGDDAVLSDSVAGSVVQSQQSSNARQTTPEENAERIRKFLLEGSAYQSEVLDWMNKNPGEVSAHVLKQIFPFLQPHGALPGVFRSERWVRHLGGIKEDCPFIQVSWNRVNGCGVYRGITPEEAALI